MSLVHECFFDAINITIKHFRKFIGIKEIKDLLEQIIFQLPEE